jgi:GNAT superfamily N-acetyltransferase
MAKVEILRPQTAEDFEKYYDLRWRILRKPWNQPRGSEKDEFDEKAFHIMALADGQIVGVGRIHFNSEEEAQIRYMAVETAYQGKGIGSLILKELEEQALREGARYIVLNGRENAVEFYRRNDYRIVERGHTLFGSVEHRKMRKDLR